MALILHLLPRSQATVHLQCVYTAGHDACVAVRSQCAGVGFHLPQCGSWGIELRLLDLLAILFTQLATLLAPYYMLFLLIFLSPSPLLSYTHIHTHTYITRIHTPHIYTYMYTSYIPHTHLYTRITHRHTHMPPTHTYIHTHMHRAHTLLCWGLNRWTLPTLSTPSANEPARYP